MGCRPQEPDEEEELIQERRYRYRRRGSSESDGESESRSRRSSKAKKGRAPPRDGVLSDDDEAGRGAASTPQLDQQDTPLPPPWALPCFILLKTFYSIVILP